MINNSILEDLDAKISLVLEKYNALKEENNLLKETINLSRETESRLRQEILKLKEEDERKDLELEEITLRINKSIELHFEPTELSIAS